MKNWKLLPDTPDSPDKLLSKLLYKADLIPVSDAVPEQRVMLLYASFPGTTASEIL